MTQTDIIKEWEAFMEYPENSDKKFVTTCSAQLFAAHISALATAAERAARQAAQAENEQLKARLAREGAELRRAVLAEREACAKVGDKFEKSSQYKTQRNLAQWIAADIRARSIHDCKGCDCADNEPCKRTAPGLALESGEFVPDSEIAYHHV